jgi:tRNA modification GTPase
LISARDRQGLSELTDNIRDMFFGGELLSDDGFYLTGEREKNELLSAIRSLDLVLEALDSGMPEDIFTVDLLDSYAALGRITGEEIEDDLADRIFSEFCMGK